MVATKISASVGERCASIHRQQVEKWLHHIKSRPPAEREQFLRSTEGVATLGAVNCAALLKELRKRQEKIARKVCSMAWLDAWVHESIGLPQPDPSRPHAVNLQLSRGETRIGLDNVPTRRWTPPQAVASEDALDCMSEIEARFYSHPPSPSAVAIRAILAMGAEEAEIAAGKGQLPGYIR